MFKLVIITLSTNNVEVYEENHCVGTLEAMHTKLEEDLDRGLYRLDVVDQDGVSVFSGKVAV